MVRKVTGEPHRYCSTPPPRVISSLNYPQFPETSILLQVLHAVLPLRRNLVGQHALLQVVVDSTFSMSKACCPHKHQDATRNQTPNLHTPACSWPSPWAASCSWRAAGATFPPTLPERHWIVETLKQAGARLSGTTMHCSSVENDVWWQPNLTLGQTDRVLVSMGVSSFIRGQQAYLLKSKLSPAGSATAGIAA